MQQLAKTECDWGLYQQAYDRVRQIDPSDRTSRKQIALEYVLPQRYQSISIYLSLCYFGLAFSFILSLYSFRIALVQDGTQMMHNLQQVVTRYLISFSISLQTILISLYLLPVIFSLHTCSTGSMGTVMNIEQHSFPMVFIIPGNQLRATLGK